MTSEAIAAWHAPAAGKRGGQPVYSDLAIETGLASRPVLRLGSHQIEGTPRPIARPSRHWRKRHLAIGANSHEIVAVERTTDDAGDITAVPDPPGQIDGLAVPVPQAALGGRK